MSNDWGKIYRKYRGSWVALLNDGMTVVGDGKTPQAAKKKAEKKGHKDVFLMSVPEKSFSFVG